ncbi:VWA domain-containing protein [Rhodocytophaga rosea]|uniref:VWA domain-containing protein n=1 Tax=Rhodocytophaga rosea TaxID=2704465 RepID=A0A6C0GQN8_9BACT|nr:VWA domain-containing protein [Rhodocytophaga rosea]QHT70386.1 VWA domain-containing protein [Rhodocytophaga rosea]
MIQRQTSLSRNIVQFCRFLRQHGFTLSVEEEATALQSLSFIDYSSNHLFRQALKSVLCRSLKQVEAFDDLFTEYWKELEKALESGVQTQAKPVHKPGVQETSFKALKSWLNGNKNEETEEAALYSRHQSLSQTDFSKVPSSELDELMRVIKALARRLAAQQNRRYEHSLKIDQPDLRRTLRKNMRLGGELMEIAFKKPKRNREKLILLCDVSKSMELYSAFLLQFMFAFSQVYSHTETFVFSTSLHNISPLLKKQDFTSALQLMQSQHHNWYGGTRIGESLHQFVQEYSGKLLNKRTTVLILSDGWDSGDIDLLEQSISHIHARSKKVIWLNPLAGFSAYQPSVAGMKAAMPYIDIFAPAHNAESLRKLGKWL